MLSPVVIALLAAVLLWWFSTGAILIAVRLAERGGKRAGLRATLLGLPLLVGGGGVYLATLDDVSLMGVYGGFLGILALWGWVELSFLTGTLTGPHAEPCPPGRHGVDRFMRAWSTIAYHEILLAATLAVVDPRLVPGMAIVLGIDKFMSECRALTKAVRLFLQNRFDIYWGKVHERQA